MLFRFLGYLVEVVWNVPVLRQRILRWFPSSGLVRASTVGAKNIASSSGCAMSRHIRLFSSRGKLRVKGEDEVAEKVQKRKIAAIATMAEDQLRENIMVWRD